MNKVTTAAGPLEKSYLNARKIEIGGMRPPTIKAIPKTYNIFFDSGKPTKAGN